MGTTTTSAPRVHFANHVANVRLKPGLARRSAAALIDQAPVTDSDLLRHQPARFLKLLLIIAGLGHR